MFHQLAAILDFAVSGLCCWHGFCRVTRVCFGISISNFMWISFVAMGKNLLIFRDITSKMATWQPYWIFLFLDTLVWLWISSLNFNNILLVCRERSLLIFSNVIFKMADWWRYWIFLFLAATMQLYDLVQSVWPSVCPSVCLSFCHTFFTMFPSLYHHEIFRSYYQWQKWFPCKRSRSKVKVTEVNTQLNRFQTVTPVWIHIWWWNDAYSLMMLRRGALLFLKVIHQISRSHSSKKRSIWPRLGVSGL